MVDCCCAEFAITADALPAWASLQIRVNSDGSVLLNQTNLLPGRHHQLQLPVRRALDRLVHLQRTAQALSARKLCWPRSTAAELLPFDTVVRRMAKRSKVCRPASSVMGSYDVLARRCTA